MTDKQDIRFSDLGLQQPILQAIQEQGYEQPTPIQAGAIPVLLGGQDMVGQAQTGTGKTAAFALPLLHLLKRDQEGVQAIVLCPTRELALQVAEAVRAYGKHMGRRGVQVLPIYGGQPIHIQLKALRRGVQVVIGTPGRVKDHLMRGSLDLSKVHFFGLDEADEMLKMGFIDDVEWILEHAPEERQVALFSATMPQPIRRMAAKYLSDPADVKIAHKALTVPTIDQFCLRIPGRHKNEALERILEAEEFEAVLIFTRTQRAAAEVAEQLQSHGYPAEAMHGGMSQAQREAVVRRLRARKTQIVSATDVAARGLDVDHIDLVVNYDIPMEEESYVHRIGRTGRAGREGKSITFFQPREGRLLNSIERYIKHQMKVYKVPGRAELLERRREKFKADLREAIAGQELGDFVELVNELAAEEGMELAKVAAAATRLAWGTAPLMMEPEPEPEPQGEETEIVIPVGKWSNCRPGDIVAAISGESGLPGTVVGSIRILERVTFVSVPVRHARTILESLDGVWLCGRNVRPRMAHEDGRPAERRRPGRQRPHRDFKRGRKQGRSNKRWS